MTAKLYGDVETGGFNPKEDALLEIAVIPVIDGERLPHFVSYMRNESLKISDDALRVNGIKREQIATFPEEKEVLGNFIKYLEDLQRRFSFYAYNAPFDHGFVKEWFMRNGAYSDWLYFFNIAPRCVLEKARMKTKYFPGKVPNHKLGTLTKFFSIKHDNAHEALSDIMATIELDTILDSLGEKIDIDEKLTRREKLKKYFDSRYVIFNHNGDIMLNAETLKNQNALQFIVMELWDQFSH